MPKTTKIILICAAVAAAVYALSFVNYYVIDLFGFGCDSKIISADLKHTYDLNDVITKAESAGYKVQKITSGIQGVYLDFPSKGIQNGVFYIAGDHQAVALGYLKYCPANAKVVERFKADLKVLGIEDSFADEPSITQMGSFNFN